MEQTKPGFNLKNSKKAREILNKIEKKEWESEPTQIELKNSESGLMASYGDLDLGGVELSTTNKKGKKIVFDTIEEMQDYLLFGAE